MPAEVPLSVGAVAQRLGVAVTTLRTWHQRYGLGPSRHIPGRHRRYTPDDLARLEVMRRLTMEGVPPAAAAHWAQHTPTPSAPRRRARDGGGHAIAVGRMGPVARGLARAALRLDAPAMREIMARSIDTAGVVATWDSVLRPVLAGIGDRYAATGQLVDVEHLLSRTTSEALGAVARPPADGSPARILLACADEEQHSLPLEALAAALAEAGVACRQFGARVPGRALADAVARTGPAAVVLWAQAAQTAQPAHLRMLLDCPARPMLVAAAGPGWRAAEVPEQTVIPATLTEAVALTAAAVESINSPIRDNRAPTGSGVG